MKKWTFLLVAIFVALCLLLSGCAKKEYSLTIAVSGQGTTVPAIGIYAQQDGQSVTISATPASGWKFDSWTGDASGTNLTVSLLMDGEKSITANFSKITYILTLVANGNGATSPPAGAHVYDAGAIVNVTANPSAGWKFDAWSGDVTGSSATVSIPMDGNKTLTANFSKVTYYILTMSVSGTGSTSPTAGTYTYAAGQVVNIAAYPGSGWKFNGWSGGVAAPSSASTTVTMDSNKAVTANFLQASQAFGPYSVHIDRGSGDLKVSPITTGDRVHFSFTVAGSYVYYYSVLDPYGNIILNGIGGNAVALGGGSFIASTSGDYKLHFASSGIITPLVLTVYYTVYSAS